MLAATCPLLLIFARSGSTELASTKLWIKCLAQGHPPGSESSSLHCLLNRGSNMSAHVLLNLLNELRKRDKVRGLPLIISLFLNAFNKFNNTGAWMLNSIYHITLKLIKNDIFGVKTSRFCHPLCNLIIDVIM